MTTKDKKVPSTIEGRALRSKAMEHERKLLAKRKMLLEDAKKKNWELEAILQMILDNDKAIEEQRQKQIVKD